MEPHFLLIYSLISPLFVNTYKHNNVIQINADMEKPFFTNSIDGYDLDYNLKITEHDLNESVIFAQTIINRMQRLETNLGSSNIHIQLGSPSHGQLIESEPEIEALRQGKNALISYKATIQLMNQHCIKFTSNWRDCVKKMTKYSFYSTPLHSACPKVRNTCTEEELSSAYRSLDGSCNNRNEGVWGKSLSGYTRLLDPHYTDGIHSLRRSIDRKHHLPSARLISTSICKHHYNVDSERTLAVMQWSQFIEHDLAHTASSKMVYSDNTIECCHADGSNLSPRYIHPFCAPISVPQDDYFYSKFGVECMQYVRSVAALRSDCTLGPMEQMNQATHFLDGSQIYGSDIRKIIKLRKFRGGMLRVSKENNRSFLPVSEHPIDHCQYKNISAPCFMSGDSRVNSHPQLTAMHTLWHREHNRIARELAILNPDWDDEKLYQETRRIVIAELQHITYTEWLPEVLGKTYLDKIKEFGQYKENIDATVSNSFATAALRVTNSLMEDKLILYMENRRVNMSLNLREHFYKPNTVEEPGHLDALIRGLATQASQKLDTDFVNDITSQLYRSGEYGFDILSLDIQRGRDHGLPDYTVFRTLCSLPKVDKFSDLSDVMSQQNIDLLKSVYRNPHDIDLLAGAMAERPIESSLLGPTFSCIMADQFLRTKQGDRYFYTNDLQPKPFLNSQLDEISKVTLARIFCDNGDNIQMMQRNVFQKISASNQLVSCLSEDIPFVNLGLWTGSHL